MDWIDEFSKAWAREYPTADTSSLLLITRLARLSGLMHAFERETVEPFDLTHSDYAVLSALRRSGSPYELSPSQLCNDLERSSGGMTKVLRRLEDLDYVKRAPDPGDRRSMLVSLTPTGIEVEEQIFNTFLSSAHDLLMPVSRRELKEIDKSLRSLLETIEKYFYR